jgi:hypothetical protein
LKGKDDYIENVVVKALQKQVDDHFARAWGITAKLAFIRGEMAGESAEIMMQNCSSAHGAWWLVLLDNSDMAGFRGYHAVTLEGRPIGKVFTENDHRYGREWTMSASHELLEMLVDPSLNLTVFRPNDNGGGQLYSYEICDPCDADKYVIEVDKERVWVSNFVYPEWFEEFRRQDGKTTFMYDPSSTVSAPFELRPGGYVNVLDIPTGTGWRQIFKEFPKGQQYDYDVGYRLRPTVGSRRQRRILGGRDWPDPRLPPPPPFP